MKEPAQCPHPTTIMSWLDKELEDPSIEEHLKGCTDCQHLAETLQKENKILKSVFEAWPDMPDITIKIMQRIGNTSRQLNPLEKASAYILIISTSILFLVLYNYLFLPYFSFSAPRLVTLVRTLSFLIDSLLYLKHFISYLLEVALANEPLFPAMAVTLSALLINIYYKRRLSNV